MIAQLANFAGGGTDFSALINMVPTPGKVTLIPVNNIGPVPVPAGPIYTAMFNPDQWDEKYQYEYWDEQEPGTSETVHRFKSIPSNQLTFNITIDGTGASGMSKDVTAELLLLRATVGFNGDLHQANAVLVVWGFFIFLGYIQSLDIKYKLFKPDGKPLRADVSLSFTATTDPITRALKANLQSADLTHTRKVRAGDRLDNLCNAIYGAPRFNLEVARANGLTSIRQLTEGTEMTFPPLEK